jgi:hypothetical protein
LNIDDDLGFAQLFRETRVVLLQLLNFFLDGIALGLWPPLLGSQGLADAGGALAPPGSQQRRIQSFAAQQCADAAGAFDMVGFRKDALLVISGEAPALGLGYYDLGIGVGFEFGAGIAASGTPVALASLGLPTRHWQQCRWRRRGNLMVVHV